MAIKHAILGLLLERRGYGYDLMQRLEERLGPTWQLNPSTVYAALDQLEGEELICGRQPAKPDPGPRVPRRARRVIYEATEQGREAFESWVVDPASKQEPIRGELQLKVASARTEDVPALLEAIDHAARLTRLLLDECRTTAPSAPGQEPDAGVAMAKLARAAAVFRLEGELRWLEAARTVLGENPSHRNRREGLSLRLGAR